MIDYAKLPKKNFLYKVSGLSRGVAAILIPKDRPKPVSVTGIGGLRMIENYFSESEDRHIMRFDGTRGAGPATARVTYEGGGVESFNIKSLSGRTDYAPGPWKGAQSEPSPDLPLPGQPAPAAKDVSEIMLPASYAADVRLVVAVVGGKLKACVPGDTAGRKWILSGRMGAGDFFAVAWARVPEGVPVVRHALLGAWSYTDRKTWTDDFRTFGQADPVPVDPPKPPTPPPAPARARDATLTATGLRLASDLVPLVAKVLVLTHAETPAKTQKFMTSRAGDEWSTGQPLSAYPSAVYQIFWTREPPARIPHHQGFPGAIKNVSHVMPDGRWNPPTTRNP